MANQFETAARRAKVRALTLYFDIEFARLDVDPLREADRIVDALTLMTPEHWVGHAVIAGQRPPSAETIAEVIAVYAGRAFESENIVAAKRIEAN